MRDTIRLPDDWDLDTVGDAVGAGFQADRPRTVRVSFLDTFDWRLAAVGGRLTDEITGRRRVLRWQPAADGDSHLLPLRGSFRFARDLPRSVLRSRLEELTGIRAVLPAGACTVQRWSCRLRDPEGNTSVLLDLENATALDERGSLTGESASFARVTGIPGDVALFDATCAALQALAGPGECPDLMELAVQARGRHIGDYSSKLALQLQPEQRAVEGLRLILLHLARTLEVNADGVIADLDTEFLHDLRVATRRTRAALAQLETVLPAKSAEPFRDEFKWLGSLTGPCRDLDVFLLEMDAFRDLLDAPPATLDPLERVIESARRAAFADVRTGLRSSRFRRLLRGWKRALDTADADHGSGPDADRPVGELASQKILRAYLKMRKRGKGLGEDPPAEALHRLRIDAKKLRYLLEFFRSLFDEGEVDKLVKELKKFQDVLGGINDLQVQQQRLREFASELASEGEVDTVLAVGCLRSALAQRQVELRRTFAAAFRSFAGSDNRDRYARLFGSGG